RQYGVDLLDELLDVGLLLVLVEKAGGRGKTEHEFRGAEVPLLGARLWIDGEVRSLLRLFDPGVEKSQRLLGGHPGSRSGRRDGQKAKVLEESGNPEFLLLQYLRERQ